MRITMIDDVNATTNSRIIIKIIIIDNKSKSTTSRPFGIQHDIKKDQPSQRLAKRWQEVSKCWQNMLFLSYLNPEALQETRVKIKE